MDTRLYCVVFFLLCLCGTSSGQGRQDSRANEVVKPLLLAHYMPWYTAQPASDQWGWHWTMNHFSPQRMKDGKNEIASHFYPMVGAYDSGDVDVLEYHLLTMKIAGIDGVIVDWYGLTKLNDYALLHENTYRLLQQCERLKMKFVICYEDQTLAALIEAKRLDQKDRVSHVVEEINWLGKYWFKSPSYVRFNRKPVLLSFGHAGLNDGEWQQVLDRVGSPVAYYSQGYRRPGAVGGFGWPVPQEGLEHNERFLKAAGEWSDTIPVAFPRFMDIYKEAGIGDGYPTISDDDGRTFRATFESALELNSRIVQIATWNDWGEGTQVEPSEEFGYRDLEVIQSRVKQMGGSTFNPDDLAIPLKILKIRRSGASSEDVSKIVELVCKGKLDEARALFKTH
ncbi:MAG: glycoside hydrolase family 71/99-like protein [Planctomycetota bacterium]